MPASTPARIERRTFARILQEHGPDQPTLCEGWLTQHLAAHVVLRERRPDLSIGMIVPALEGRLERHLQQLAEQPYATLVDQVREGPSPLLPTGHLLDVMANEVEFFVHGEDVRRAAESFTPRELAVSQQRRFWTRLGAASRLSMRGGEVGVVLVSPGFGRKRVGPADRPSVVVTGAPAELLLWVYGRREQARVQVDADSAAAAALERRPPSV